MQMYVKMIKNKNVKRVADNQSHHKENIGLTKFSDRQVWANSADPDQTDPRGAV